MSTKLSAFTRPEGESDKQFLVSLREQGHLSDLQLRAVAARYDELTGEDRLAQVLREFDEGKVRIANQAANGLRPPSVFDAPKGESVKQVLVWLHEQGSISPVEMRAAAEKLNETGATDLAGLAAILRSVGAVRALPLEDEEPAPPAPPAPEEDEEDEEDFEERDIGPSELYAMTAPQVRSLLRDVDDTETVDALHAWERENPKYAGGRKVVLDALEERKGELTTPNPNV